MSTALELITHHFQIVIFILIALVGIVIIWIRRPVSPEKAASWPVTEGTIESVSRVFVKAVRYSHPIDVGDFSYTVNNEYYSGRLTISRSFSTHDGSPKDLVDKKIQVRYDPRKPEKFSVPQQEQGGFLLDPYDEELSAEDVGPIDLNIG